MLWFGEASTPIGLIPTLTNGPKPNTGQFFLLDAIIIHGYDRV